MTNAPYCHRDATTVDNRQLAWLTVNTAALSTGCNDDLNG